VSCSSDSITWLRWLQPNAQLASMGHRASMARAKNSLTHYGTRRSARTYVLQNEKNERSTNTRRRRRNWEQCGNLAVALTPTELRAAPTAAIDRRGAGSVAWSVGVGAAMTRGQRGSVGVSEAPTAAMHRRGSVGVGAGVSGGHCIAKKKEILARAVFLRVCEKKSQLFSRSDRAGPWCCCCCLGLRY
jgi:hypothetical protein